MKIILLDIDGVMVPAKSWQKPKFLEDGFPDFSLNAVNSLNIILNKSNAKIILTTSHKSNFTIQQWEKIFKLRNIQTKIDKLNDNLENLNRKDEILNWLSENNIIKYVIIDDDKSLNGLSENIKEHLFLTDSMIGLNSSYIDGIIKKLNSNEKTY